MQEPPQYGGGASQLPDARAQQSQQQRQYLRELRQRYLTQVLGTSAPGMLGLTSRQSIDKNKRYINDIIDKSRKTFQLSHSISTEVPQSVFQNVTTNSRKKRILCELYKEIQIHELSKYKKRMFRDELNKFISRKRVQLQRPVTSSSSETMEIMEIPRTLPHYDKLSRANRAVIQNNIKLITRLFHYMRLDWKIVNEFGESFINELERAILKYYTTIDYTPAQVIHHPGSVDLSYAETSGPIVRAPWTETLRPAVTDVPYIFDLETIPATIPDDIFRQVCVKTQRQERPAPKKTSFVDDIFSRKRGYGQGYGRGGGHGGGGSGQVV